jgi:hypothetical protein
MLILDNEKAFVLVLLVLVVPAVVAENRTMFDIQ